MPHNMVLVFLSASIILHLLVYQVKYIISTCIDIWYIIVSFDHDKRKWWNPSQNTAWTICGCVPATSNYCSSYLLQTNHGTRLSSITSLSTLHPPHISHFRPTQLSQRSTPLSTTLSGTTTIIITTATTAASVLQHTRTYIQAVRLSVSQRTTSTGARRKHYL